MSGVDSANETKPKIDIKNVKNNFIRISLYKCIKLRAKFVPKMPFTFSHIGYVLPIQKKWKEKFSITGLVFGSLAPDYDILFRLTNVRFHIFQYDIKTILLLIFPLALLSALLFHLFCRNIIIENLPLTYQLQYKKYQSFNFFEQFKKQYLRISFSIIFSIYLHLFLDFLCHCLNAYYIKMIILSITQNYTISIFFYIFAIYGLPVLFSVIGFYLIYVYEYHKKISIKNLILTKSKFIFWFIMFLFTVVFSAVKFCITEVDKEFFIDFIVISVTSSFLIAVYATCICYFCIEKIKSK